MYYILVGRVFIYVIRRYIIMAAFYINCVTETVVETEEVSK